ncbi:NAD(P)H-binding protein [Saccharomonospora sp. NPDC006951]
MTILVTGATGNIGRMVVDELAGSGERVRALTTNPAKAALPGDVEIARGYLGKPETLPPAFEGIDTVYLAPMPDTIDTVARMAKDAGVRRVVALTSILANDDAEDEYALSFVAIERAIIKAGLDWTFLCPGAFMENTENWAISIRAENVVRAPFPLATDTPMAMRDIAVAAAAAMVDDKHANRKYPLSGPEAITIPQQVAAIADALGRDIRYIEQTKAEAKQEWLDQGVDSDTAEWLLAGGNEMRMEPEPGFEQLTGRGATTYAEWARRNADRFR